MGIKTQKPLNLNTKFGIIDNVSDIIHMSKFKVITLWGRLGTQVKCYFCVSFHFSFLWPPLLPTLAECRFSGFCVLVHKLCLLECHDGLWLCAVSVMWFCAVDCLCVFFACCAFLYCTVCDSLYKYSSGRIVGEMSVWCVHWQLYSLSCRQLQQLGLTTGACNKFLSSMESR